MSCDHGKATQKMQNFIFQSTEGKKPESSQVKLIHLFLQNLLLTCLTSPVVAEMRTVTFPIWKTEPQTRNSCWVKEVTGFLIWDMWEVIPELLA